MNTEERDEDQPFISSDGGEIWFTGTSRQGYPGPAVFRSLRTDGEWTEPVEIIWSPNLGLTMLL